MNKGFLRASAAVIGVIGALYRMHLEGDGVPASVVVKLQGLDEAAAFTGTMLRMYIREVRFYERMATRVPVRVPAVLHTALDEETSAFVIARDGMTVDEKELRHFCRENLAGYKVPKHFDVVPDLPRTPTGKILKRKAGQDHFNSRESGNTTRNKRTDVTMTSSIRKAIKKALPYSS